MKHHIRKFASTTLAAVFASALSALASGGLDIPTVAEQNTFNPRITIVLQANPEDSWVEATLANVPAGFSITNTSYLGWCIDSDVPIDPNVVYQPVVYSSLDTAALITAGISTANLDKVNYILNHKPVGANALTIQDAIYTVLGETGTGQILLRNGTFSAYFGFAPYSQVVSDAIVADANANGVGFVPAAGQIVAVIVDVPPHLNGGTGYQRNIIEVVRPPEEEGCLFLVIDEDTIDNTTPAYYLPPNTGKGVNGRTWTANDVNDDRPKLGQRTPLRFFNNPANFGRQIVIRSGQISDEGMFAVKTIPASWVAAGPTTDGLKNYIGDPCLPFPHNVGNGLGRGNDPESRLDKIPKVTPLRAAGLKGLIGRTVCAIVYDSDINVNFKPLIGSLKGETLGVVAFKVLEVKKAIGFSSSTLPLVTIEIVDPCEAFTHGHHELYLDAPEPIDSSTPFDITP